MHPIALACVAALGLLVFAGGWLISVQRFRSRQFGVVAPDPASLMFRAVRAHANTCEYAPFLAVLMLWLGAHDPRPWVVVTMICATACRYVFVAGMLGFATLEKPNPVRFVGAAGTYAFGLALCAALFTG